MIITPKQSYFNIQSRVFVRKTTKSAIVRKFRPVLSRIMGRNTDELTFQRIWIIIRTPVYRSPLKTSCERKCAVRAIFVVKPPRKAYSLTSSAFLESGTPCPFLLFAPVFRGSHMGNSNINYIMFFVVLQYILRLPSEEIHVRSENFRLLLRQAGISAPSPFPETAPSARRAPSRRPQGLSA